MKYILLVIASTVACIVYDKQPVQTNMQKKRILTYSDSTYINNVLHDSLVSYYHIAFDIKAPDYVGRVTIQVIDLGYFFSQTRSNDLANYKQIMRELILYGDTLVTSTPIYKQNRDGTYNFAFHKVKENGEVERLATEGKEVFLEHFFIRKDKSGEFNEKWTDGLRPNEILNLKSAIINQLFEWRIYATDKGLPGTFRFSLDDTAIQRELERRRIRRMLDRGEKVIIKGKP